MKLVFLQSNDKNIIIRSIEGAALVVTTNRDIERKQVIEYVNKYGRVLKSVRKLISSLGNFGYDYTSFLTLT